MIFLSSTRFPKSGAVYYTVTNEKAMLERTRRSKHNVAPQTNDLLAGYLFKDKHNQSYLTLIAFW
jgi:hypothetical protein